MTRSLAKVLLVFIVFHPMRVVYQAEPGLEPQVSILAPGPGQAVRGSFSILADIAVQGFVSAELAFAYQDAHLDTWFLIGTSDQPLDKAVLTEWDTTLLTDETYRLRLVVLLKDGSQVTHFVDGVRVRNYSPVETDTPTPSPTSAPVAVPASTETPVPTPTQVPATPTPLPPNPLTFSPQDIGLNFLRGAVGGVAFIVLAGLFLSARNLFRK